MVNSHSIIFLPGASHVIPKSITFFITIDMSICIMKTYINHDKEGYTFWDYMRGAWQKNNGMRIDHFLVSNSLLNIIKDVKINKYPRGKEKPSDHTPIEIELA